MVQCLLRCAEQSALVRCLVQCLLRWAEQHPPTTAVACPLCRTAIANSYQDVTRLGETLQMCTPR